MKRKEEIKSLQTKQHHSETGLDSIKGQIGYTFEAELCPHLARPDISITEKVDAICKHFGIEIVKKPEEIKVVKKEDK